MSSMNLFDQLIEDQENDKPHANEKPIWAIDLNSKKSEEELKKWLRNDIQDLKRQDWERIFEIRENRALFKGLHLPDKVQFNKARSEHPPFVRSRHKKLKVNHLYDLTEQHVSRLVKFKPGIAVSPTNMEEFGDRVPVKY